VLAACPANLSSIGCGAEKAAEIGRVRQRAKVFWFFFSKKNILSFLEIPA
jgi:hypothetical protein